MQETTILARGVQSQGKSDNLKNGEKNIRSLHVRVKNKLKGK